MTRAEIPLLLSRRDVANLLGVELRYLTWWLWAFDASRRYTEFEIQRRNGSPRRIAAPIKPIKDMQRTLASHMLEWYVPPAHVHGFARNRSPVTNAERHRRQQWLLRVDIAEFFPSINFGRVRGLFMAYPFDFPEDVATVLAQLCCHENSLPQGAPTSPVVSNFICRGMDRAVAQLAIAERCYMTRYADDITFSTDRTAFPPDLARIEGGVHLAGPSLVRLIEDAGFRLNPSKTRLTRRTQRQRVTGLVVNRRLNVPRQYVTGIRNLLYIWERYGEQAAAESYARAGGNVNWPPNKPRPAFSDVARGKLQYVGSIRGWEDPTYLALARRFAQLDPGFKYVPPRVGPITLRVVTEGQTDVQHLTAALSYFQTNKEFQELEASFDANHGGEGDSALQRYLRELPPKEPSEATVCLFDRDVEKVLRDEGLLRADFVDRGNGVAGAALVTPLFRAGPFCVEMLYTDTDLATTNDEGRRIYLKSEFDEIGHHKTEACSIANKSHNMLVRDDVFEFGTKKSLALSKTEFAALVANRTPSFDTLSFEGFRPTFEMLLEAGRQIVPKVKP